MPVRHYLLFVKLTEVSLPVKMMFSVSFLLCFTLGTLALGHKVNILDEADEPISSIAEQVCLHHSSSSKQISKISTIVQLGGFLKSLPVEHKLSDCSSQHLVVVEELVKLVSSSNDNVCGPEKIALIEEFHRAHVLKGFQTLKKIPKILKTFFYHYVHLVSYMCASEATKSLEQFKTPADTDTSKLDELLVKVSKQTGVSSTVALQYQNIFLLWDLIDMLPLDKQDKIEANLLDGEKRLAMRSKNSAPLKEAQIVCLTQARPVYSGSLLASIKLIHLGYYPHNSSILDTLNNNKQARGLYELTKVCETILPVMVVDLDRESDSEAVLLTEQEVEELRLAPDIQSVADTTIGICDSCSLVHIDSLPTVTSQSAVAIAKRVKSDVKSRKSAITTLLKVFLRGIKSNASRAVRELFGAQSINDIESTSESQLDQLEVYESEEDETTMVRNKRWTNVMKKMGMMLGKILKVIVIAIVGIVLFPVTFLFCLIVAFNPPPSHYAYRN